MWIGYSKFIMGDKGIEHRIICAEGSFAQHHKMLHNQKTASSDRNFHTDFMHGAKPEQKYLKCQYKIAFYDQ